MRAITLGLTVAFVCASRAAASDVNLFDRSTVQGTVSLGAASSDAIASWTHGGFGKTQFGKGTYGAPSGEVVWRPELTDSLSLVIDGVAQTGFGRSIDFAEAYVLYKPLSADTTHVQARVGMLYPPVSLEHNSTPGEPWIVLDTITPSAINTWIGEEVKALGVEGAVERTFDPVAVSGTVSVFSHNDTAGTLLAMRGWAFSDAVATASGHARLPPLSDYAQAQSPHTDPVTSIDDRVGGYARLKLSTARGAVDLTVYDNNAALGVGRNGQWGWRTRFLNLGAVIPVSSATTLSGQMMDGHTEALIGGRSGYRFNLDFRAAYVRLVQHYGAESFTGRLDIFDTRSKHLAPGDLFYHPGPLDPDETYSESGWAGLGAWKHHITAGQAIIVEALHVTSKRTYVSAFGALPHQASNTLRAAYRLSF